MGFLRARRPEIALALALALTPASEAAAEEVACGQDAAQSAPRRAHDCHVKGLELFERGRFRQSKRYFERARSLYPRAIMLYNIGSCCEAIANERPDAEASSEAQRREKLEHVRCAIAAFESYLAEEPDSPKRAALERRIEGFRARERSLVEPAPEPRPAPRPAPRSPPQRVSAGPSPWPWIVAGAGGAGLVAGALLAGLAHERNGDAEAAAVQIERAELRDEASSLALGANVAFVAGGVVAAAGIVWGIVDAVGTGDEAIAVRLGPGGAAFALAF